VKMYVGEHFGRDGVFVESGGKRKPLDPRFDVMRKCEDGFAWGRFIDPKTASLPVPRSSRPMHPGAAQLAFAILAEHYSNIEIARRAYLRFAYRVLADLNGDQPLMVTADEVEAAVAAIKQVEYDEETRANKAQAARERPTPVTEFGADIVWDQYEEPKVNKPGR
jgi:hypothetical protein